MTDEQQPRDDRPQDDDRRPAGGESHRRRPGGKPYSSKPGGGKPGSSKPGGGKPYGGKHGGGKPYGGKPGGGSKPYRGQPAGGRPYGGRPGAGKPYGGRPGRKPYQGRPDGDRPHERDPGAPGDPGADDRPRADGEPPRGRPGHTGPRHERRFEYSQRERPRGPRPAGGPRDRERGPRRGGWDRRDRFAPPRPQRGPAPSDVLAEDEEIVAGRRPVEEAFAARREAKRLLVVPERRAALDQLVLHATTLRIPVVEVEGGTITAVSGFDGHQGVALVVAPRRWATLDDVLALARTRGEPPFVLALDHLEDPQNVGTLLRSAEACGVHGVLFPTKGAAPISPAAIKTSAGAVEHLLLVPVPDLAAGLVDLHARGLRVIGADGDARLTVREVDMRGPIVVVTGSEGRGLNARVRRRVDLMARIPMRGRVASLNASVAGSVFLFEAATQRDLPEAELPAELAGEPAAPDVAAGPEEPNEAQPAAASESSSTADAEATEPATSADPPSQAEPPGTARPTTDTAIDRDDLLPEAPPAPTDEPR